jgi:hypothetical protein
MKTAEHTAFRPKFITADDETSGVATCSIGIKGMSDRNYIAQLPH